MSLWTSLLGAPSPSRSKGRDQTESYSLVPDDQRIDNTMHQINHYPLDSVICPVDTYPLDSDFSGGQRYPPCEQLGTEPSLLGRRRAVQTRVGRARCSQSLTKEAAGPSEILFQNLPRNIGKTKRRCHMWICTITAAYSSVNQIGAFPLLCT